MLELYQRIKKRREELGMTQDELARKLGYKSRSSINKIERGENDIPQSKIIVFANALQTTPESLMGWEPEKSASRIALSKEQEKFFESEETKLLNGFQSLDKDGQNILLNVLNSLRMSHSKGSDRMIQNNSVFNVGNGNSIINTASV